MMIVDVKLLFFDIKSDTRLCVGTPINAGKRFSAEQFADLNYKGKQAYIQQKNRPDQPER